MTAADPLDEAPASTTGVVPPPRSWPWVTGTALGAIGLSLSGYLTYAHYTTATSLACPETSLVNCVKVTTSSYSHIMGFPVAVLGLLFFVVMLPLQLPSAWRSPSPAVRLGRLGATLSGVVMVMWLLYAELFPLGSICLYCSAVHVVTLLLFVCTALGTVATASYGEDE